MFFCSLFFVSRVEKGCVNGNENAATLKGGIFIVVDFYSYMCLLHQLLVFMSIFSYLYFIFIQKHYVPI
jgi:hypothetical protein